MSNHSFDIHIAAEYKSVEIAILVWHFQYWIMKNKRLNRNRIEGRTWTYQTLQEINASFPYWSNKQVERLMAKAVQLNILIKKNHNKSPYDRTLWYAFVDEEKFGISRFGEMENCESGNQNPQIGTPIPNTLPYTLTNTEREEAAPPPPIPISKKKVKQKVEKIEVRENILLSEAEHDKLLKQYGEEKLNWMLDYLEAKKGANGNAYKSDYHVLLPANWVNGEYKKQCKEGKVDQGVPKEGDYAFKNKKMAEFAEDKLRNIFTGYVYIQTSSTYVLFYHKDKDIAKRLSYAEYEPPAFKEVFLKEMQTCFPNYKEIFNNKPSSVNSMVNNLANNFKMKGI